MFFFNSILFNYIAIEDKYKNTAPEFPIPADAESKPQPPPEP